MGMSTTKAALKLKMQCTEKTVTRKSNEDWQMQEQHGLMMTVMKKSRRKMMQKEDSGEDSHIEGNDVDDYEA